MKNRSAVARMAPARAVRIDRISGVVEAVAWDGPERARLSEYVGVLVRQHVTLRKTIEARSPLPPGEPYGISHRRHRRAQEDVGSGCGGRRGRGRMAI